MIHVLEENEIGQAIGQYLLNKHYNKTGIEYDMDFNYNIKTNPEKFTITVIVNPVLKNVK